MGDQELPPALLARLRELHDPNCGHVCERGDSPSCGVWDALVAAHQAGRESAFEEALSFVWHLKVPSRDEYPTDPLTLRQGIWDAIRAAKGPPVAGQPCPTCQHVVRYPLSHSCRDYLPAAKGTPK